MYIKNKVCRLGILVLFLLLFSYLAFHKYVSKSKLPVPAVEKKQISAQLPAESKPKPSGKPYSPSSGSTELKDVIRLDNKAYDQHVEEIVVFEHRKHSQEYAKKYPELFKSDCGECHHDDQNNKLVNLKEGDRVQNCIECHKKPGEVPENEKKALKRQKLPQIKYIKKIVEYQGEALHINCLDCHILYRRQTKHTNAPVTCAICHAKPKKK